MNITLTGSLGHIGKPLATQLLDQGHQLTIVSSQPERAAAINTLGATPATGHLQDIDFLTTAFSGADAVFTLAPPANYWDQNLDLLAYFQELGHAFAGAVRASGVPRVVNLSSIGAHLESGNGILRGTHYVERYLDELPAAVAVTHVRPTEIYYNLLPQVGAVKSQGVIAGNQAPDGWNSWVSPLDIAERVATELTSKTTGRRVVYVASDEVTNDVLTRTLGAAVGKPDLKWVQISDTEMTGYLTSIGMQPAIAAQMTEMYAAIRSGVLYEDYRRQPVALGRVKVSDFAEDFAAAYRSA